VVAAEIKCGDDFRRQDGPIVLVASLAIVAVCVIAITRGTEKRFGQFASTTSAVFALARERLSGYVFEE